MVPQPQPKLLWAVRIPGGELRCLTWQVAGQWCVGVFEDDEMLLHATAHDSGAVDRWSRTVRREIDRLGLGTRPVFDPAIDVTIDPFEPYDTFDALVGDCDTIVDAVCDAWRH